MIGCVSFCCIVILFRYYPIYFIEFVASIITKFILVQLRFPFFYTAIYYKKIENKKIAALKMLFPNKSETEIRVLNYRSMKIGIMNVLIAICNKILYKFTYFFDTIQYNIPNKFYNDIKSDGIILVLSHSGLIHSSYNLGKMLKTQVHTVVIPYTNKWINIYPKNYYENCHYIKLESSNTFQKLLQIKKEIIVLACDQLSPRLSSRNNIKVIFLNKTVSFPSGPAVLHVRTNRKIWSITHYYDEKKKKIYFNVYKISIKGAANLKDITQKIANELSYQIMHHPEQYYWVHMY